PPVRSRLRFPRLAGPPPTFLPPRRPVRPPVRLPQSARRPPQAPLLGPRRPRHLVQTPRTGRLPHATAGRRRPQRRDRPPRLGPHPVGHRPCHSTPPAPLPLARPAATPGRRHRLTDSRLFCRGFLPSVN